MKRYTKIDRVKGTKETFWFVYNDFEKLKKRAIARDHLLSASDVRNRQITDALQKVYN